VALCVSQSTGTVTVFRSGKLITDLHRAENGSHLAV
jgi:DNA integrity scanning protein DisA with diadenylate cyclase activity